MGKGKVLGKVPTVMARPRRVWCNACGHPSSQHPKGGKCRSRGCRCLVLDNEPRRGW